MIVFDLTSKTNSLNRIMGNWNWSYLLKINLDLALLSRVRTLYIIQVRCNDDLPH